MTTLLIACLMVAQTDASPAQAASKFALKLDFAIALPGVEGSFGHPVYRPHWPTLFVPARENGTVELIELYRKAVGVPWTWPEAPHTAAYFPFIDHVAVTDAKHGYLMLLDSVFWNCGPPDAKPCGGPIGDDPGCVRYLPEARCLLVGWGAGALAYVEVEESKPPRRGKSSRAYDGEFTVLHTIALSGHPESFQFDAAEKRAWVNVPSTKSIAVVDLDTKTVARTIEMKELANNYPMALAEKDKRLLVGCRDPGRLLVLDTETDALVAELPLSGDVDDLFVDEYHGLVFASSGEGHVDVFERVGPGAWKSKEKVATGMGARTCWFDGATKQLFVVVPHQGEQKAEVLVFATDASLFTPKPALTLEVVIPLPGVEGRIDHMAIDPDPRVLFVAALENGSIERVDLKKNEWMDSFTAPGAPAGAVLVDSLHAVVVADGSDGTLWMGDARRARNEVPQPLRGIVGPDADNIRYLWKTEELLVGYGAGALAFVGAHDSKLRGSIELGGHPESFQLDSAEKRCWVNVPDKRAIAVIDLAEKKVVRWIGVTSAAKNYPMALAEKDKRLLVGCREPAKLLVYDIESDELTDELPLSGDVDDIFVDEERGLVYASCGEGFVDVFERRTSSGAWFVSEKVATAPGARTCLFDAVGKKLFVAVPHRGEQKAEVRVFSTAP